ncbi:hypothetical protein VNI00_001729 [Paramarasmius palmivorus]|uniref:Zn(2)-C6 fungal-type domain-containing protein n=1 Tax=Paramarasmius palmivorus TaxID=297713 RepID=A0AAW0E4S4_9AGAR
MFSHLLPPLHPTTSPTSANPSIRARLLLIIPVILQDTCKKRMTSELYFHYNTPFFVATFLPPNVTAWAAQSSSDSSAFYETFPGARPLHYQSSEPWSAHRMGDGIFGGNYAFHYQPSSFHPQPPLVDEYSLEQPQATQVDSAAYLEPAHCQPPHDVNYSSPICHSSHQLEITNYHDANVVYTFGEPSSSSDVKHSQSYSSLVSSSPSFVEFITNPSSQAQATLDNIGPCHDGECVPTQHLSPTQTVQHVSYTDPAQQSLTQAHVKAPVMDYLPEPRSPEATYSQLDSTNNLIYTNDSIKIESIPLPVPSQQPVPSSQLPASPSKPGFENASAENPSPLAGNDLSKPVTRKRRRIAVEPPTNDAPRSFMYKIPLPKPNLPQPPKVKRRASTPQTAEKKSLALACFFCRGRKIACGPQDPNSPDRTCGQCHRRSLKCEYPTESRRGMRKRKTPVVTDLSPDEE